jgi:hypothetical protein
VTSHGDRSPTAVPKWMGLGPLWVGGVGGFINLGDVGLGCFGHDVMRADPLGLGRNVAVCPGGLVVLESLKQMTRPIASDRGDVLWR